MVVRDWDPSVLATTSLRYKLPHAVETEVRRAEFVLWTQGVEFLSVQIVQSPGNSQALIVSKTMKTHFKLEFGELCWCAIGHCRCEWKVDSSFVLAIYGLCLRLFCPVLHLPPERPSLLELLAARFRINFWLDGWSSISCLEVEPMHLSVEGLRPWDESPVLQYLREWPTPAVFVTGTVVKHQPSNQTITVGVTGVWNGVM